MKKEKLSNVIGALDRGIIEEAAVWENSKKKKRRKFLKKYSMIAACLSLVLIIGLSVSFALGKNSTPATTDAPITESIFPESSVSESNDIHMLSATIFVISPEEQDAQFEENCSETPISSQSLKMYSTALVLDPSRIGETLYGYLLGDESNADLEDCAAFVVKGLPSESVIAVRINGEYIAFATEKGRKLLSE